VTVTFQPNADGSFRVVCAGPTFNGNSPAATVASRPSFPCVNAHEHQWNVSDPISDVAAMRALFPAVVSAAQALGTDAQLGTIGIRSN
jgi:hypothetical protein